MARRTKLNRSQRLAKRWQRTKTRWHSRYRKARATARKAQRTSKRAYRGARKFGRKAAGTYRAYFGKPKPKRPAKRRAGRWYKTVPKGTGKPRTPGRRPPARPPATPNRHRPPARQTAAQAAGWVLLAGGATIALSRDGFNSTWLYGADLLGGAAVAAAGYHLNRRFGWSNHGAGQARQSLKNNARMVGCNAACQRSPLPVRSCRCPCGGKFHGGLRGKANP